MSVVCKRNRYGFFAFKRTVLTKAASAHTRIHGPFLHKIVCTLSFKIAKVSKPQPGLNLNFKDVTLSLTRVDPVPED